MKNNLVKLGILLLVFFLIAFNTVIDFKSYKKEIESKRFSQIDMVKLRSLPLFLEINNFPRGAGDDILFLSKLNEFKNINLSEAENSISNIFFNFIDQDTAYRNISYIDATGQEIVRVYQSNNQTIIVNKNNLQNVAATDYFKRSLVVPSGQVAISSIRLEELDNGVSAPIFKYSTPVYDSKNKLKGVLELTVQADYFLNDIRNFSHNDEKAFLIDAKGMYLANVDQFKEFDSTGKYNFQVDYGEAAKKILNSTDETFLEDESYIYSFQKIIPSLSRFEIYKGSLSKNRATVDDYLILVVVSNKTSVNSAISDIFLEKITVWALQVCIVVLIMTLFYFSYWKQKKI